MIVNVPKPIVDVTVSLTSHELSEFITHGRPTVGLTRGYWLCVVGPTGEDLGIIYYYPRGDPK